ncbi:arabinogalactan endo-1,4-beta-galactosidase [Paenibacillus phyllosphaerae]|uniref:Arabinogalactan endo-beta-1,4-galactanase n=1 Tax=Paenibacillus phyllosphaerae TaxID=274593 RepID=A0A7W5AVG0_9BACL|nr:glycosyl hydrolase 53 family protein [Paenibacillus phyllosphaerae]MBB3109534.1 arabinogalactan endo-1,4-beta-galactosidase [Paenibacillus phyllosphaerae]
MKQAFIKGADISILNELESLGGAYYLDQEQKDLLEILRLKGLNCVRLRLWVNPYDESGHPYMGGTNDLKTTLELAKRAKAQGLAVMLDFHYSDFWADPKKQIKPKAWQSLTGEQLEEQVYRYTQEVLAAFAANEVLPELVQIGNETTNGTLWPDGQTPKYHFEEKRFVETDAGEWKAAFDRLARLLQAGVRAAREAGPIRVILHLDAGGSNVLYRTWFDEMAARQVDYDIIGLSYYPIWHGSLDDLSFNMRDISERYGKEVLVVETAYGFTADSPSGADIFTEESAKIGGYPATVEGQAQFLHDLMTTVQQVPGGKGLGIVYWEPAWLPVKGTSWASPAGMQYCNDIAEMGNHWANQGLFDFGGNALASLDVFRKFE